MRSETGDIDLYLKSGINLYPIFYSVADIIACCSTTAAGGSYLARPQQR